MSIELFDTSIRLAISILFLSFSVFVLACVSLCVYAAVHVIREGKWDRD